MNNTPSEIVSNAFNRPIKELLRSSVIVNLEGCQMLLNELEAQANGWDNFEQMKKHVSGSLTQSQVKDNYLTIMIDTKFHTTIVVFHAVFHPDMGEHQPVKFTIDQYDRVQYIA